MTPIIIDDSKEHYQERLDAAVFAQLFITEAGRPDRTVIVQGTVTIGRDAENDIVLASQAVSRHHAMLLRDDVGLLLVDLESTNGTLVNGVLAPPGEPVRLNDGDVLGFGQVVARYVASSTPAPRGVGDHCAELAHAQDARRLRGLNR